MNEMDHEPIAKEFLAALKPILKPKRLRRMKAKLATGMALLDQASDLIRDLQNMLNPYFGA
jgi:uncharacterized protein (DUF1810 family)